MKRLILILAIGSTLFACKNEETQKELENLRNENTELTNQVSAKDSTLKLFEESFTTIQHSSSRGIGVPLCSSAAWGGGEVCNRSSCG